MLYSYDVFDTVITRTTATPKGIFALMRERLLKDETYADIPRDIRLNFYELRVGAERFARANYVLPGRAEIYLKDIYRAMNVGGELTEEDIRLLMELEEETEVENTVAVPSVTAEILEHLHRSDQVVFISDMYLPKETIRSMLGKAAPEFEQVPLYLSEEIGQIKRLGGLFYYVRDDLSVPFDRWQHTGDHPVSDVGIPEELGIGAVHVPKPELLPSEKKYLDMYPSDACAQLMIGAAKNTRHFYEDTPAARAATSIGGILLCSYALWIIRDALKKGIRTLHFVARDGFVIKELVDVVIKKEHLDLKTRYIYGSRKAWRMPSMEDREGDLMDIYRASDTMAVLTVPALAKLFGVSAEQLKAYLPEGEYLQADRLERADVEVLVDYLDKKTDLKRFIVDKYSTQRALAQEYFRQELDLADDQICFVEIGGSGFTQQCLKKLISPFYRGRMSTYFFHVYGKCLMESSEEMLVFMKDEYKYRDAVEPLCRAVHGMTTGYKKERDLVVPILEAFDIRTYERCDYTGYLRNLSRYMDVLAGSIHSRDFVPDYRLTNFCWDYLIREPDQGLLDFICDIPFDTHGNDDGRVYAPKLTPEETAAILANGPDKQAAYYNGASAFLFSLFRLDPQVRESICAAGKDRFPKVGTLPTEIIHLPLSALEGCNRIVLYGAGRVGKEFRKSIPEDRKLLWVDRHYFMYRKTGRGIESPAAIREFDPDIVILALLDSRIAAEAAADIEKLGVPASKIRYFTSEELLMDHLGK